MSHKGWITLGAIALAPATLLGCALVGIRTIEEPAHAVVLAQGDFQIRKYDAYLVAETTVTGEFRPAANTAFRGLFRYISGANEAAASISMTAPVLQDSVPGSTPDPQAPSTSPKVAERTQFTERVTDTTNASSESGARARPGESIPMTAPVFQEPVLRETAHQESSAQSWRMAFVLPATYTLATAPVPTDPAIRLREVPPRRVAVVRYSGSWSRQRQESEAARLEAWLHEQGLTPSSAPRWAAYDPPMALPFLRRNEVHIDLHPEPAKGENETPITKENPEEASGQSLRPMRGAPAPISL